MAEGKAAPLLLGYSQESEAKAEGRKACLRRLPPRSKAAEAKAEGKAAEGKAAPLLLCKVEADGTWEVAPNELLALVALALVAWLHALEAERVSGRCCSLRWVCGRSRWVRAPRALGALSPDRGEGHT